MTKDSLEQEILYVSNHRNYFVELELGWKRIVWDEKITEFIGVNNKRAVKVYFLGNGKSELSLLENLPNSSVWVWLYGDETFQPTLNFKAISSPAVIGVIRPYPLHKSHFLTDCKSWLTYLMTDTKLKSIAPKDIKKFVKYALSALVRIFRIYLIGTLHDYYKKKSLNFIPGYTNLFAQVTLSKNAFGEERVSLIEKSLDAKIEGERVYDFSFIGQSGSPNRFMAIRSLEKNSVKSRIHIVLKNSFGGTEGANDASLVTSNEYINILTNSRFALCPSGNFAGTSFRWLESLILGAIPIQSHRIPSDPAFESPVKYSLGARETWPRLLRRAEQITESERIEINKSILRSVDLAVSSLNDILKNQ